MRRIDRLFPLLALLVLTASCGYNLGSEGPVSIAPQARDLYIERVDNPTIFPWMESRLRGLFRDEITRRGWARWVDRKQATGLVTITVRRYLRNTSVYDRKEETLRYNATLYISARVTSPLDGSVLWESGEVTQTEPFFRGEERAVDDLVTELAVRQLVDRMTQGY
ncbi:MAG: LPS assembly lipoprotein LptE [Desulfovibrionaceae bacterium]|jgi:outer membrane lipopolysaccharide assembly protein LptE/RlpB|nr:LPS assembly lipoprotein LptE [Desulfovibrionaceae bacterium]